MSVPNAFAAVTSATGQQLDDNFAACAQLNAANTLANQLNFAPSVVLASAGTVNIGAAISNNITISGAVTITAFDTIAEGALRILTFTGAPLLTYNVTSMQLIGGGSRTVAAGDVSLFRSLGGGNWKEELSSYSNFFAPITASLGADVLLNNTANYFDGPSVAQGTVGKWFVSGTITFYDAVSAAFLIKLWDGTTVIASTEVNGGASSANMTASLSGFISAPVGNLRISVKDGTTVNGVVRFNTSGNSKDSTITAIRIG